MNLAQLDVALHIVQEITDQRVQSVVINLNEDEHVRFWRDTNGEWYMET